MLKMRMFMPLLLPVLSVDDDEEECGAGLEGKGGELTHVVL